MRLKLLSLSVMAIGAGALPAQAFASGYNFGSQSVSAQGTAHANAAEAADPSTIYYNPAGMSMLEGDQISIGLTSVVPDSSYTDNGSHTYGPTSSTSYLNKIGNQSPGHFAPRTVIVPNLYMTHQIDNRWTAGIGIYVPYGAKLDYGGNWPGRYALEHINLQSVNINPSISFKLDEHHSFGAGLSAQYMSAQLQKAVDTSTGILMASANPALPAPLRAALAAAAPGLGDGQVKLDASGWGYGFNLGYLYKLDDHTRFGLSYRSKIKMTLSGSANWDYSQVGGGAVSGTIQTLLRGAHNDSAASTDVTTPQSATGAFYRDLTDKLAVMGTVTWTGHSDMQNITVKFLNTTEGNMVINQNWKDSWLYAFGANYKYNDKLLLRGGVAYDQSPTDGVGTRHPALPDSDRYWLSIGANYKFDKHQSVDIAYSYVWFKDADVNYADNCTPVSTSCTGNGETTKGTYKTHLQMLGLQYNYRF